MGIVSALYTLYTKNTKTWIISPSWLVVDDDVESGHTHKSAKEGTAQDVDAEEDSLFGTSPEPTAGEGAKDKGKGKEKEKDTPRTARTRQELFSGDFFDQEEQAVPRPSDQTASAPTGLTVRL